MSGVAGKYELFDTISVKQILAPSVTGVTIVSAPGGETQSWESIEEGFNFNDAAGYTYDIYEIPSTTLTGDYTSAVQNMGSIKTVRHWGEFDLIFNNVAASWEGEFSAGNTWADKLESSDTWLSKFVGAIAGDISIRLWYSEDNITWNYIDDFQLLSCEITAQYVQYQIFLTDNDANSYIYVKSPFTGKAYYWQ
ncbi:MAG: hypothetical protein A4E64_01002 [Syntrophorhabdus sp. PtaU1.Bin058]|nr:MAG: hypothetical protein A4E64_01002 [Syntrophorhabdus sp. PtaU1.Bin058]